MKPFFTLCLSLFCLSASLLAQNTFNEAVIHPDLMLEMETPSQTHLPVYILLADRVDVGAMDTDFQKRNLTRQERVPQLLQALQAKAQATQGPLLAALRSMNGVKHDQVQGYWISNLIYAQMTPEAIKQFSNRSEVELIEYIETPTISKHTEVAASMVPNGKEVGLAAINAPEMWDLGYTGYGRKVLIMDTGVDGEHPALKRTYYGNFVPANLAWFDQWGNSTVPTDCDSHGTHVTGTTVGMDPNTNDTVGVAFNAFWMGSPEIPGFSPDCVSQFNPAGVFQWALDPDGDINTTDDMPDVINNSWRTQLNNHPANFCNPGAFGQLQITTEAAGIIAVFGAGNEGPGAMTMGAEPSLSMSLVNNFSVGSINAAIGSFPMSGFSSRGPSECPDTINALNIKPEVVAPGSNVRSTTPNNTYAAFSGTSMATPHVSGAFLLLREAFPTLSAYDIKMGLYMSAIDLGAVGEDNSYGNGLIDVKAAYDYLIAQGNTPIIPNQSNDLAVDQIVNLEEVNCSPNLNPILSVKNNGNGNITSAEIALRYSDGVMDTISWTGLLFPAGVQAIVLPTRNFSSGGYSLAIDIFSVNQTEDYYFLDNQYEITFQVLVETITADPTPIVCPGSNVLLSATPSSGDIVWYDAPTGGSVLGTGNTLQTPNINANTSFYAIIEEVGQGGKDTYIGDNGFVDPMAGEGLIFDAFSSFTLKTVTVFCQGDGLRTIELRDENGNVLQSKDLLIGLGPRVLDLNFNVPAANNLMLAATGPGNLFVSSDNISYPYFTSGMMEVKSSTLDQAGDVFYPYFYDWQLSSASMCDRVQVPVQVGTGNLNASFTASTNQINLPWSSQVDFTDQTTNAVSWAWDFGDGATSTVQSPTHTYALVDTFTVILTVTNADGCTDIASTTIEVRGFNTAIGQDVLYQEGLHIFPNPGTSIFFLEIAYSANDRGQLQIFDTQGRVVRSENLVLTQAQATQIDLSDLPDGIYTVLWRAKDRSVVNKLIKQ
ncbi:MAG: S8 family serine peptidase [Bacteroidia bacterium]